MFFLFCFVYRQQGSHPNLLLYSKNETHCSKKINCNKHKNTVDHTCINVTRITHKGDKYFNNKHTVKLITTFKCSNCLSAEINLMYYIYLIMYKYYVLYLHE